MSEFTLIHMANLEDAALCLNNALEYLGKIDLSDEQLLKWKMLLESIYEEICSIAYEGEEVD